MAMMASRLRSIATERFPWGHRDSNGAFGRYERGAPGRNKKLLVPPCRAGSICLDTWKTSQ